MNSLEEAIFKKNIIQSNRAYIETRLKKPFLELDQLKHETSLLSNEVEKSIRKEQTLIIDDIVNYNKNLIPANEQLLHKIINHEKELQKLVEQKNGNDKTSKVQTGSEFEVVTKKYDKGYLKLINLLESINFPEITNIKKVDKTCAPSFNKIWIWVLEIYYGVPSSKYFWEEFSKKVFSTSADSGKEIRRRMIIFDVTTLSPFQFKELEQITQADLPLLTEKLPKNEDLLKFFDCLRIIYKLYSISAHKKTVVMSNLVSIDQKLQEEEKTAVFASQKLNAIKFDIVSEVQNLYLLIDSEFK